MSSNGNQTPDLASILRTLASLAPQSRQQGQPYVQTQETSFPPQVEHAPAHQGWHQNYTQVAELPRTFPPQVEHPPAQQGWHQNVSEVAEQPRPSPPVNPAVKIVDPATIIEWSAGLRCVMKTVAKHENMLHDIRRMVQIHHEHEEQWWKGREALIEKQKARIEGQKKLEDILPSSKAVGGTSLTGTSNTSSGELAKELEIFDTKVYKAQMQMVREMTTKLRNLGVPFFGTRSDLVRPIEKEGGIASGSDGGRGGEGMIDETELVKLQRKMVTILEDLCND